jgi:hypothetical protein
MLELIRKSLKVYQAMKMEDEGKEKEPYCSLLFVTFFMMSVCHVSSQYWHSLCSDDILTISHAHFWGALPHVGN